MFSLSFVSRKSILGANLIFSLQFSWWVDVLRSALSFLFSFSYSFKLLAGRAGIASRFVWWLMILVADERVSWLSNIVATRLVVDWFISWVWYGGGWLPYRSVAARLEC